MNPAVNAVTVVLSEQALEAAKTADSLVAGGGDLPPLRAYTRRWVPALFEVAGDPDPDDPHLMGPVLCGVLDMNCRELHLLLTWVNKARGCVSCHIDQSCSAECSIRVMSGTRNRDNLTLAEARFRKEDPKRIMKMRAEGQTATGGVERESSGSS